MSTAAAAKGPIRPRTRGPVELILESLLGVDGMNQTYFLKAATVVDRVAATSTVNTSTM